MHTEKKHNPMSVAIQNAKTNTTQQHTGAIKTKSMTFLNVIHETMPHQRIVKKVKNYRYGKKHFAELCKKANLVPERIDSNTVSAVVRGNGIIVTYFRERQD